MTIKIYQPYYCEMDGSDKNITEILDVLNTLYNGFAKDLTTRFGIKSGPMVITMEGSVIDVKTGSLSKQEVLNGINNIMVKLSKDVVNEAKSALGKNATEKQIEKYIDDLFMQARAKSNEKN